MRPLSIELEDELVDALETERKLFGFETRGEYVRWIIANRGSISAEQRGTTVDASSTQRSANPGPDDMPDERGSETIELVDSDGGEASRTRGEDVEATKTSGSKATAGTDLNTDDAGDDEGSAFEIRGSPRTVRRGPGSADTAGADEGVSSRSGGVAARNTERCPDTESKPNTGGNSTPLSLESETGSCGPDAPALTPERVARIREDPIHEDANVLGSVESERLDELSRRAVATTRKRLGRDVQTGLEYTSSTRLAGSDVRPGEDITDLEELSIPGRSAETVEKRRHAIGRALAYLRDEGRTRRSDVVDALYTECPAGYETADSWWRCIKTGFKQVEAVDGGEGSRLWRYRG